MSCGEEGDGRSELLGRKIVGRLEKMDEPLLSTTSGHMRLTLPYYVQILMSLSIGPNLHKWGKEAY